ncbi:Serine/threonine-protein kinase BRI1-like 1 [Geodia barretti]|uniref:Serine/threonine-protein kinase BRI1-like 1 n=1 Tax=Geodia barretti TaxID=519541 RepID=A0AA35SZY7_GEOBA|nr:Serine/threonine-protein kinase BRI1-like 1 [Geodia barretti]
MVAKIADLGMARIVPGLRASTMTKAPGASVYMPPEALEDESRYDVTIDIFSLGVLATFALSQTFPKPLAAAYMDDSGRMVGRTELERRGNYMREVTRQFREGHPLVQMIQQCLKNRMRERPTIQQVMGLLEEARAEVEDGEYDVNKLSLAQLLQSRSFNIQQQRIQIDQQQQQIRQKDGENHALKEQNDVLKAEIAALKQSQKMDVYYSNVWDKSKHNCVAMKSIN